MILFDCKGFIHIFEDEWSVHNETFETVSGEESDVEDNVEPYPVRQREENPDLPETCTVLETPQGSKVYVVGTAHFSTESLNDVTRVSVFLKYINMQLVDRM